MVVTPFPSYSVIVVRYWLFIAFLVLLGPMAASVVAAQEAEDGEALSPELSWGLALGVGVQSYPEGTGLSAVTYQYLALRPEIAYGKLGVGFDLGLNYRFTGGDGSEFRIREEDWVPSDERSFWEIYLAKISYARWAQKGDPLYVRVGNLDDVTLGNGFIVGGYANTRYLPDLRIVGAQLDADGDVVGFPYLGFETMASNLTAFDLFAVRTFVRPIVGIEVPVISRLQVGSTIAMDRDPYYFAEKSEEFDGSVDDSAEVMVWGVDTRLPILDSENITLAAFSDFVLQDEAPGAMIGVGGRAVGFLLYGAQLRYLGDNFIPVYFDGSYDLFRLEQFAVYDAEETINAAYWGWLGSLGVAFFDDSLVVRSSLEGPIGPGRDVPPTLRGSLFVGPVLLAGFFLEADYTKKRIVDMEDLTGPEDSAITARLGYQSGPTQIAVSFRLRHDPFADGDPWQVSSGLESSIVLR